MKSDKINELEKKILLLIRQGHSVMSELMDITGLGGEVVNRAIESLDQNRFIEREGFVGGAFWTFSITQKGLDILPEMNETQAKMYKLGLWPTDLDTLRFFQDAGAAVASEHIYAKIGNRDEQRNIAASMIKLLRLGYMREFGFIRRKVKVNEKGIQLLDTYSERKV